MSLMNYLGAVASAAVEAASAAALQQQSGSPVTTTVTSSNIGGAGLGVGVGAGGVKTGVNRSDQGAHTVSSVQVPVVATASSVGNVDSITGRTSVTVPQTLAGVPFGQITLPTGGQFYISNNGPMRFPHVSSAGPQRTFTVHPASAMTLAGRQVPAHLLATAAGSCSSQPQTVEIRLPQHPSSLSPQVTAPVGSHIVDKRPGIFQLNTASFRGTAVPVSNIAPQQLNTRSILDHHPHHHHEVIRRDLSGESLRLKSPPPTLGNLNTSRPSVLMPPRNSLAQHHPHPQHRHVSHHEYISRADPAVALQDHNYTLPKRMSPIPTTPVGAGTPNNFQMRHHHHHAKDPSLSTSMSAGGGPGTMPVSHHHLHRPPQTSPPPQILANHKLLSNHQPPPPIHLNPKPPTPVYGNSSGTSPPSVSASVLAAKGRRPRSASPVTVPGRRRRRKALEKNMSDEMGDIIPGRKAGVPGRKRSRKQTDMSMSTILNNTIPPYPTNNIQEPVRNPLRVKSNTSSIPESEPTKQRRMKKNKFIDISSLPTPLIVRKGKDRKGELLESDVRGGNKGAEVSDWYHQQPSQDSPQPMKLPEAPSPAPLLKSAMTKETAVTSSNNSSHSTPPEDSNNEGITRCICDYLHDDGFMICCDKCYMWQHVDCMGIDRADIPDSYLCEVCNPRWVSKSRARAIQTRKKEMMELGIVEDDSTPGDSDADQNEKSRGGTPLDATGLQRETLSSPSKSSTGKLKRRGRPSLSNGQPFMDSDSEVHGGGGTQSPISKRSRKHSGKRAQNLSSSMSDVDGSPSKIGSRKRRSVEPNRTRRSYTRRSTLSSPLSSPSMEEMTRKGMEDHKENSVSGGSDDVMNNSDESEIDLTQDDKNMLDDQAKNEGGSKTGSEMNGILAGSESRRKRKQIFRDIPNGDLSPPHILSSGSPTAEKHSANPRSPTFDKLSNPHAVSNNSGSNSPGEPSPSSSTGVLHLNLSAATTSFNSSTFSCPYSSSPYLDKYEEAENAVCSYSPELRAKLLKNLGMMGGNSSVPDFTPLTDDEKRWKLGVTSLEGGKKLKTLLVGVRVEPGHAIIEFIGKFLMHTGFIPTHKKNQSNFNTISPEPFVFFHQVPKNGMCICIDCRKYGNDARFVRRSCTPNAEIRHVVGKGTIHAYIVATATIDVDEEVTIPHEFKSITCNTMNSVVQKYHVVPPPLPCACSDLDTCKAVILGGEVAGGEPILLKKNGALVSPTSSHQENKERRRRMSSRRTSSLEKEPVDSLKTPPALSPLHQTTNETAKPTKPLVETPKAVPSTTPTTEDSPETSTTVKERSDGRTTRARTVAIASSDESSSPVSSKRKSDPPLVVPAVAIPARQRNKSGTGTEPHQSQQIPGSTQVSTAASETPPMSSADTHKMTREERKLQSVLKLIEKMESNQKKKDSRQSQKKDRTGKDKKSMDDRETDQDEDFPSNPATTASLAPIRFAPANNKKKGRKRGRSASKPGGKPQMITQRSSGSIADMRSTSTESDINSADESSKAGMSPLQENLGPNFRLPKKKELMSEWRIGTGGHPSPTLPSQYMRKANNATTPTSSGATTPPVQPSPSAPSSSASFLVVPLPATNGSLDNASAKKRWLRQAISEETDPLSVPSPNSRPSSPAGVECVAPLKKRRLARASMSSEVSNTPPSTPNNAEAGCNEMDGDGETEGEREDGGEAGCREEEPRRRSLERTSSNRKWSCSEVSSAEEDMDDGDDIGSKDDRNEDGESAKAGRRDTENEMEDEDKASSAAAKDEESECFNKSPQRATTPRKSRWDQVDAPGPVLTSSNSNSPVKSSTTDAIVLDYVRNPEQYAKLTGVNAAPSGATAFEIKEKLGHNDTSDAEEPEGNSSTDSSPSKCINSCPERNNDRDYPQPQEGSSNVQNVESSPKTPAHVKKKVKAITLSMEEYLKMAVKNSEEKSTAFSNPSTALNSTSNSDMSSSDSFVSNTGKEVPSPKPEDEPTVVGTLQFSSTPTLAERKREELGKRLSKSFGIRVPDVDVGSTEKQPTPTYISSPRDVSLVDKQKPNGDIGGAYSRVGNVNQVGHLSSLSPMVGHRLSVPTPAALKQSGMPPLPPSHSSGSTTMPNGATKTTLNTTQNGYMSSSQSGSAYRHYRGAANGPSTYSSHHPGSNNIRSQGANSSLNSNPSSSGPIIGGVPMGNLIPPPPPPTASQGSTGPAFGKRFYNKKFFPS